MNKLKSNFTNLVEYDFEKILQIFFVYLGNNILKARIK